MTLIVLSVATLWGGAIEPQELVPCFDYCHTKAVGNRVRRSLALVLSAASAVAGGCSGESRPESDEFRLGMFASAEGLPPSTLNDILFVDEFTVCTPETYRYRIVCGDVGWTDVTHIGGLRGEGPGELQMVGPLFRTTLPAPGATVGVVDWESQRASVFSVDDGEVVADFPVPPLFRPVAPMADATLLGLYEDMRPPGGGLAEVDTTGSLVRDLVLVGPIEPDAEGVRFVRGLLIDSVALAIQIQGNLFGVYSTQGELRSTFSSPFDADQPRPERDVEEFAESRGSMFGAPSPAQIEEYRRRPPPPIVRETNLRIGPDGTLWMATRQGDGHSYLAVFRRDQLVAELEVRHRLLGFDIWEDRLVTLVERPHRDDEGLYVRGLDYYRIQGR